MKNTAIKFTTSLLVLTWSLSIFADVDLNAPVMTVTAKRLSTQYLAPSSAVELDQSQITQLPQGDSISLPKLLATTTPGVVQGTFGQTFIRGNHANIQYQIDGVQLPDSGSNAFGQSFSPKNIDHMEFITGGIPAEYGQRLAAVVNITTKSGPQTPGGTIELGYGSANTWTPSLTYGGTTPSGNFKYYFNANYSQTDRGLDTPQPKTESDPIHDQSWTRNEFTKLEWHIDPNNKTTVIFSDAQTYYQIPNTTDNPNPNDTQLETNQFIQAVYRHKIDQQSFFQLAPYWKYSGINFKNDLTNDLATNGTSFSEDRHVNNYGLKGDYTNRLNPDHLLKIGFQTQSSKAEGSFSIASKNVGSPPSIFTSNDPDNGFYGSLYAQDEINLTQSLLLNIGLRYDYTHFTFSDSDTSDSQFSPRIGLTYFATDTTKLHASYGKLFQPAPLENLRNAFTTIGGGTLSNYDIKAEKDDFYEIGINQKFTEDHSAGLNIYYKNAVNMLDEAQLLNTSIAQPFNFASGYAYGIEFTLQDKLTDEWSDFLNYSYEIAKGSGISGGIFAFAPGQEPGPDYQFLDHVQIHTINAGLTYTNNHFWSTLSLLYGSGLRTGQDNNDSLPSHLTGDFTLGYEFNNGFKVSSDILNILDNPYPITLDNGFNGSHYAAGRTFAVRVSLGF